MRVIAFLIRRHAEKREKKKVVSEPTAESVDHCLWRGPELAVREAESRRSPEVGKRARFHAPPPVRVSTGLSERLRDLKTARGV